MIKLILSLVLIISATLVGNSFSVKLRTRSQTLNSIILALTKIKTMLCFGSFETKRILEDSFCSYEFQIIDKEFLKASEFCFDSIESIVYKIPKRFSLNGADKDLLRDFISGLGSTDVSGQVAHTELYLSLFSERYKESKAKETDKSKLYRIMGFSFGSAISLLIA